MGKKKSLRYLICKGCKKCFEPISRNWKQRYCSMSCAGLHNKNKGRFKKDIASWNKGLKGYGKDVIRTKEWKEKIGKANSGIHNGNWRGGTSELNNRIRRRAKYKNWRKTIFERDNYTCQFCGKRGGKLEVDHIKPFALFKRLRYKMENGRTLCVKCHKTTETYGKPYYTGTTATKL